MNTDAAPKIVTSLVKALQVVCHGYMEFDRKISIIGHIHINVDEVQNYNYVLDEKVKREDGRSSTFVSNSFYAKPQVEVQDAFGQTEMGIESRGDNHVNPGLCTVDSDVVLFTAARNSETGDDMKNSSSLLTSESYCSSQSGRQTKRDVHGNIRNSKSQSPSSTLSLSSSSVTYAQASNSQFLSADDRHKEKTDASSCNVPRTLNNSVVSCGNAEKKHKTMPRLNDESRQVHKKSVSKSSVHKTNQDIPSSESPQASLSFPTNVSVSTSAHANTYSTKKNRHSVDAVSELVSPQNSGLDLSTKVKEQSEEVVIIKEEVCEDGSEISDTAAMSFQYESFRSPSNIRTASQQHSQSRPRETSNSRSSRPPTSTVTTTVTSSVATDYPSLSHGFQESMFNRHNRLYPVALHANMLCTSSDSETSVSAMMAEDSDVSGPVSGLPSLAMRDPSPGPSTGTGSQADHRMKLPQEIEYKQTIHLWQFFKELLLHPESYSNCIRWVDRSRGIFKIEDSYQVARLWGKQKNRPAMNYDKLSRSIRQYYKKGIIRKTEHSQRLIYQFCPQYL